MNQPNQASQCSMTRNFAGQGACQNVGQTERNLSALAGGLCLGHSLWGRIFPRPLSLIIGAGLLYRAFTGHCQMYSALGLSTAEETNQGSGALAQQHSGQFASPAIGQSGNRESFRAPTDASLAATGEGGGGDSTSNRNRPTGTQH